MSTNIRGEVENEGKCKGPLQIKTLMRRRRKRRKKLEAGGEDADNGE
jgi:hypothetical protein